MASRLFRAHGDICASHPWEVIVATLTLTACMLTVDKQQQQQQQQQQHQQTQHLHYGVLASPHRQHCNGCFWLEADFIAADAIVMTLIRCMAVLYCYYQFCNLHKLGSKYILGIAGLFTVFSSFVFTSTVINFLRSDISDLKDALFFFLLLIDLSKAALLAQFALSSSNQNEVKQNIARGMALLGPTITLDTVVETLVIGVGTLSGVRRLEVLCWFACLSVLVNYIVFMTFYPACLSLILELSRSGDYKKLYSDASRSLFSIREEDQKPNPVVQRVKLIMSLGLMIVHAHSRWPLRDDEEDHISPLMNGEHTMTLNRTEDTPLHGYIIKWVTVSADHIVIFILLLALAIKFIFFETKEDIASQIRMAEEQEASKRKKKQLPKPVFTSGDDLIDVGGTCTPYVIVPTEDKEVQTENLKTDDEEKVDEESCQEEIIRSLSECISIYETELSASSLTDKEVIQLIQNKRIPGYQIEKAVKDLERGVGIRRQVLELSAKLSEHTIADLPFRNYDYSKVMGACCENVIGYVPVPVGVAGPLHLDGQLYHIPLATTEGCLVASINRGSRALINGINSRIVADGMTRGPVVRFPCLARASQAMAWMEASDNFKTIKESFDSTSRFARLSKLHTRIAGRILFVRFVATTGDAMGMNMLSKGTETALKFIRTQFPDMEIISLSGNFCTDKKPAAVNWIEGRGKSVVCEAVVPANIITTVLKSNVHALIDVNRTKNMIGSAIAGSIGGFNAHAANVVTAMFIATGQDPAQNVGSSNCITLMEPWGKDGEDLYITCTMPSVEVGTIGGGTALPPQAACLEMLGIKGPNIDSPGENSKQLARIVCGAVLAGELSLISALAAGHLVGSHLKHNRSSATVTSAITESSKSPTSSTLTAISSSCYKS